MKKFTLGIATGAASLAVAVPLLAQFAGAQTSAVSVDSDKAFTIGFAAKEFKHVTPTQACVQAMADLESAHLANFDAMSAKQKQMMQTRVDALNAAAAIADDDAREEAMKNMHESMMDKEAFEMPEAVETAMEALKEACGGNVMMFRAAMHGGMGMAVGMPGAKFDMKMARPLFSENLAEKLGMTKEELKTALEDGKTIEELAEEKGIELPMMKVRKFIHTDEVVEQ